MTEVRSPWPDRRASLFAMGQPSPSSPTWCSLKWLTTAQSFDDGRLAEQFMRAADAVVEDRKSGRDHGHADALFMPIAYLFRHAIELKLKHLIRSAGSAELIEISDKIEEKLAGHALHPLWIVARSAIEARWPDEPRLVVNHTEALIQDFHRIDRSGQRLRYTRDLDGASTMKDLPDAVDLEQVREAVQGVFNLLDGCESEFRMIAECLAERRRDAGL